MKKPKLCLVMTSIMTANAFLVAPINKLCEEYEIYLLFNGRVEELSNQFNNVISVIPIDIERKVSLIADIKVLFALIKLFRRYHFDCVHSVTPKAGLLAMLAAFVCKVDRRIHMFTGQVWATKTGLSRIVFKKIDTLIAFLATNVLADSPSQRQFLIDEKVVKEDGIEVLGAGSISGVDTTKFSPNLEYRARIRQELGITETAHLFLFLGRINKDKGVIDLANAFAKLDDKTSHLLIVGPDEDELIPELKQVLSNCYERSHFIGFSPKPEYYMAAADTFCLPSYREGFGTVILESAAAGIPAIGTKIYGVTDAIVDHETGLLFEAGDQNGLAELMQLVITDHELWVKLSDNARVRATKYFSSQKVAEHWLSYYRVLL